MRAFTASEYQDEVEPLLRRVFRSLPPERRQHLPPQSREPAQFLIDSVEPFTPAITARVVFEQVMALGEEQRRAVAAAAQAVGDTGLYFCWRLRTRPSTPAVREQVRAWARNPNGTREELWAIYNQRGEPWTEHPPAYYVPLTTSAAVDQFIEWYDVTLRPGVTHQLLSPSARWGVLMTDEERACVGGDEAFIAAFCAALRTTPEALIETYVRGYEIRAWRFDEAKGIADGYGSWSPRVLAHVVGQERAQQLMAGLWDDAGIWRQGTTG